MTITDAQFADFPNRSGQTTFSYAELLAQLTKDLPSGASPNIGLGAIARNAGGSSINNLLITPLVWDNIDLDDLGFLDISSGSPRDERFIIPDVDPPIERVVFGGQYAWNNSALGDIRGADTRYNFNGPGGLNPSGAQIFQQNTADPTFNNRATLNMGVRIVAVGDIFTLNVFQDTGGALTCRGAGWIRVIK